MKGDKLVSCSVTVSLVLYISLSARYHWRQLRALRVSRDRRRHCGLRVGLRGTCGVLRVEGLLTEGR